MATVTATIGSISPFLSISGDRAPGLKAVDPETGSGGAVLFDSIRNDTQFTMSVSFTATEPPAIEGGAPTQLDILSVAGTTTTQGVAITSVGNVATITGKITGIFDEQWEFVMKDGSVKILPINNNEDWDAVVRWRPASTVERQISYTFVVSHKDSLNNTTSTTISIPQYVYWHWAPSLSSLKDFVKRGSI